MEGHEFSELAGGSLLRDVEAIVVDAHRALYAAEGRKWSRPVAYQWLRYENPDPVARLADGVKRLRKRGAKFDSSAVDKACAEASKKGFLN
jgi:hypothetical protein